MPRGCPRDGDRPEDLRSHASICASRSGVPIEIISKVILTYTNFSFQPILESLLAIRKENIWPEIANLVISTLNDNPKMIDEMCRWIRENSGQDTHFTRFSSNYKAAHLSRTPVSTLEPACEIAKKSGLIYVYIGNVQGHI